MSLLLTREEYESIASDLALPQGAFIDGELRPAAAGGTFETLNDYRLTPVGLSAWLSM